MKYLKIWLPVFVVFGLMAMAYAQDASKAGKTGPVRHIVCIKFKDGAKAEDVKKAEDAFIALKGKIPVIQSLEWGTNCSPEKMNQGFTHCFFLTFKDEKDRDSYLPHPEHKAFGGVLGPVCDKVFVLDYVVK